MGNPGANPLLENENWLKAQGRKAIVMLECIIAMLNVYCGGIQYEGELWGPEGTC